jgi:hypothetical protein
MSAEHYCVSFPPIAAFPNKVLSYRWSFVLQLAHDVPPVAYVPKSHTRLSTVEWPPEHNAQARDVDGRKLSDLAKSRV